MPDPLLSLAMAALAAMVLAVLFWPQRGLFERWRRARQTSSRVLAEDALKHIHKCEMQGRRPTLDSLAGAVQIGRDEAAQIVATLQERGLLVVDQGDFHLTPAGREAALHIIRAHRLWESYLAERTGFEEADWHSQAERLEHTLPPEEVDALAAQLGNPTHDPHGDPIPDAGGQFVAHGGQPLTALPVDTAGRIVHIEDEPEAVYAQLVAEGLYPGMAVRMTELLPQRVRFWANGDEHLLAPLVAANVTVVPLSETAAAATAAQSEPTETLADLKLGERGTVTAISPRCRGAERRRFMDLGILPGTVISAELASAGGDPIAYNIREALIALRREQARMVQITRHPEPAS